MIKVKDVAFVRFCAPDLDAMAREVRNAMEAGAVGIAVGRNVWQHANPAGIAKALAAVVHEDASVESALKAVSD